MGNPTNKRVRNVYGRKEFRCRTQSQVYTVKHPQVQNSMVNEFENPPMQQSAIELDDQLEPEVRHKNQMGEQLFVLISKQYPKLAGKITGMLLALELNELYSLLESQKDLDDRIVEALFVLRTHEQQSRQAPKDSCAASKKCVVEQSTDGSRHLPRSIPIAA